MFVELVFIPESKAPLHEKVHYRPGLTVQEVVLHSNISQEYPEVLNSPVGIFSSIVSPTTLVKPGDRVEIYRPLKIDPKESRRQRVSA